MLLKTFPPGAGRGEQTGSQITCVYWALFCERKEILYSTKKSNYILCRFHFCKHQIGKYTFTFFPQICLTNFKGELFPAELLHLIIASKIY